jgi:hypothetical protein
MCLDTVCMRCRVPVHNRGRVCRGDHGGAGHGRRDTPAASGGGAAECSQVLGPAVQGCVSRQHASRTETTSLMLTFWAGSLNFNVPHVRLADVSHADSEAEWCNMIVLLKRWVLQGFHFLSWCRPIYPTVSPVGDTRTASPRVNLQAAHQLRRCCSVSKRMSPPNRSHSERRIPYLNT